MDLPKKADQANPEDSMPRDISESEIRVVTVEDQPKDTTPEDEITAALREYVPGTKEEKAMIRKVDMFIIPILWLMCILAYIDRNNIVRLASMALTSLAIP